MVKIDKLIIILLAKCLPLSFIYEAKRSSNYFWWINFFLVEKILDMLLLLTKSKTNMKVIILINLCIGNCAPSLNAF